MPEPQSTLTRQTPRRRRIKDLPLLAVQIKNRAHVTHLSQQHDATVIECRLRPQHVVAVGVIKLHKECDLLQRLLHQIRIGRAEERFAGHLEVDTGVRAETNLPLPPLSQDLDLCETTWDHRVDTGQMRGCLGLWDTHDIAFNLRLHDVGASCVLALGPRADQ
jgi:hypothetical protein